MKHFPSNSLDFKGQVDITHSLWDDCQPLPKGRVGGTWALAHSILSRTSNQWRTAFVPKDLHWAQARCTHRRTRVFESVQVECRYQSLTNSIPLLTKRTLTLANCFNYCKRKGLVKTIGLRRALVKHPVFEGSFGLPQARDDHKDPCWEPVQRLPDRLHQRTTMRVCGCVASESNPILKDIQEIAQTLNQTKLISSNDVCRVNGQPTNSKPPTGRKLLISSGVYFKAYNPHAWSLWALCFQSGGGFFHLAPISQRPSPTKENKDCLTICIRA